MAGGATPDTEVALERGRLLLRPWRGSRGCRPARAVERTRSTSAVAPPNRRGWPPSIADLEESIRTSPTSPIGFLAVEEKACRDVIGYRGLTDSGRRSEGEPELAFELLRRFWRQGYANEASLAVLDWARSSGYERLWATVWDWNTASRRVLAKVGFAETQRKEADAVNGTTLFTTRRL